MHGQTLSVKVPNISTKVLLSISLENGYMTDKTIGPNQLKRKEKKECPSQSFVSKETFRENTDTYYSLGMSQLLYESTKPLGG